jgi:DNA-binding transcriptional ArsR family regulator
LANPHRLELLDLLVQAPCTVEELAQEVHMSVANTSQHLQRLKQAWTVTGEREGLYIRYDWQIRLLPDCCWNCGTRQPGSVPK